MESKQPELREPLKQLGDELAGGPEVWDKILDKILDTYYPKDAFPTLWKLMETEPQIRGVLKGVTAEAFSLGLQRGAFDATQEFQSMIQQGQAKGPGTTGRQGQDP